MLSSNGVGDRINAEVTTESGIPVSIQYTPEDICKIDYQKDIGTAGKPPFTRGIHAAMYRERIWTIRQLSGFGRPEDTNARHRLLLDSGATGVNTVFDYPTNRGYDSDHVYAEGDVGQGGVAVDSLGDMLTLYEGIPLDEVSVSVVLSHPVAAPVMFAMYLTAAEERGYSWDRLRGTLQNDFLMETVVLTAPNTLQPAFSFKLSMDVVEFCHQHVPHWNGVSWTGYNYREAGANAVQEAGLVIANALATAHELVNRGHHVDAFGARLSAFFTADNDMFEEIAKYRAARRVYYKMFKEQLGATDDSSASLRFHVQTSGSALTAQQPLNNVARAAYHALTAVLGGAQSLHVSAFDEAVCVPSELAALTAMRTQQILVHETGVTRTVDPLAGSYYVESLTNDMELKILDFLRDLQLQGGLISAVESGWVHRQLMDTAFEREVDISNGLRPVVGVNCFTDQAAGSDPSLFRFPDALAAQKDKLQTLRSSRDSTAVERSLAELRTAVLESRNVMPPLLQAVRLGATLGECCEVFRQLYGGWPQPLM